MLAISAVAIWNERFGVPERDDPQKSLTTTDLDRARDWRKRIEERVLIVEERVERLEAQLALRQMVENDVHT